MGGGRVCGEEGKGDNGVEGGGGRRGRCFELWRSLLSYFM